MAQASFRADHCGVVSTASGIVFDEDAEGNLCAFGSDDGSQLATWKLPGILGGGIVSYTVGGKQYVAVPSGGLSRFFGGAGAPMITVYALDASNPAVVDVRPSPGAVAQSGAELFASNCAGCHGSAGTGATAPSLEWRTQAQEPPQAITWIENPTPPMPKLYPSSVDRDQVEAIAKYLETL